MTTGQNGFRRGLPPSSTAFVHFALDVVSIASTSWSPGSGPRQFPKCVLPREPASGSSRPGCLVGGI